jgi:type I restriction enzyme, R subunit
VAHIRTQIAIVGFWQNAHQQNPLRKWVFQYLDGQQVGGHDLFELERLPRIADSIVDLARANHAKLITKE